MIRDFFLGFIRIHILYHAARGPVYGLSITTELRRHGYEVSYGTLYPILHRLEAAGYLSKEERVVARKVRKYYTTTAAGNEALAAAKAKIRELTEEVLEEKGPTTGLSEGDD